MVSSLSAQTGELTTNELFLLPFEALSNIKITSSTLHEETLHSAPSSVTVIKREEIKRLGLNRLTELMNYIPGYQTYKVDTSALSYSLSSRGHRLSPTGREVLILIDGHRVNDDFSGGTTFFNPYISLDNVEQVEFIRGPGSAIYGSNAFLGVVNIKTKGSNQLMLTGGSTEAYRASLQAQIKSNKLEFSIFVKDDADDGDKLIAFDPGASSFTNTRDQSDNQELYASLKSGNLSVNTRLSKRDMPGYYNGGFLSDEVNERTTKTQFLNISHQHAIDKNLNLSSTLHFSRHTNDTTLAQAPDLRLKIQTNDQEYGIKLLAKYDDKVGTRWLTGLEYRLADIVKAEAQIRGALSQDFLLSKEGSRTIGALFGQYQSAFDKRTHYVIGGRWDDFSDTDSHFSPRLGLIHALNRNNTLKLLYGEAFRAPTRVESDLIFAPGVQGNPNINPEISTTLELVWVHTSEKRLLSTTLFDTKIDDTIIPSNDTSPIYINSSSNTIAGLELELQQEFSSNWNLRIAATHNFDEFSKNNQESDTLLTASISYITKNWTTNLSTNYQSQKVDDSLSEFKQHGGHTLYDMNIVYLLADKVDLSLKIRNLFNKQYLTPATRNSNTVGVPNRGTNAELSIKWQY